MMGTPMMGVMALMGITPWSPPTLKSVQNKAMSAPARIVTGMRRLWLLVASISLAMCGTTSPRKPIGPQ